MPKITKTVTLEYQQWSGENVEDMREFAGPDWLRMVQNGPTLTVPSPSNVIIANPSDYIIRVDGGYQVMTAAVFTEQLLSFPDETPEPENPKPDFMNSDD